MNTLDALFSRRSIRCFNGEPVTDQQLRMILKAAYAAPVGHARYETLHLTVISNADFLSRLEKATASAWGTPDAHPFYGSPTVILVSSVMEAAPMDNVYYSNAASVVQNMALAATELGVGACHIWGAVRTLNDDAALREELSLPEGMIPCCAIAIGQTEESYALREIPDERIATAFFA